MKKIKSFEVTSQVLAEALIDFVAYKSGILFFPYKIIRSNFVPPQKVLIEILQTPTDKPVPRGVRHDLGDIAGVYVLKRTEIAHALSMTFMRHHRRRYEGNVVKSLPDSFPEELEIELEYVPMGSSIEEGESIFGSLGQ